MFTRKRGFTVIEVVIVIAVVAIIAGIWYISKNKAGADFATTNPATGTPTKTYTITAGQKKTFTGPSSYDPASGGGVRVKCGTGDAINNLSTTPLVSFEAYGEVQGSGRAQVFNNSIASQGGKRVFTTISTRRGGNNIITKNDTVRSVGVDSKVYGSAIIYPDGNPAHNDLEMAYLTSGRSSSSIVPTETSSSVCDVSIVGLGNVTIDLTKSPTTVLNGRTPGVTVEVYNGATVTGNSTTENAISLDVKVNKPVCPNTITATGPKDAAGTKSTITADTGSAVVALSAGKLEVVPSYYATVTTTSGKKASVLINKNGGLTLEVNETCDGAITAAQK